MIKLLFNMILLESFQPELTTWQFYAMEITLLAVGIGYIALNYWMAVRDTVNGYELRGWKDVWRSKISMGCLFAMAAISYFFLPDLYHSFMGDTMSVVNDVVDSGTEMAKEAYKTGDVNIDWNKYELSLQGLIWGWPQGPQKTAIYGTPVCAVLLGFSLYLGSWTPSPVGTTKKALKVVAWFGALATLLLFNRLHYFNAGELVPLAVSATATAVCLFLSMATSEQLNNPPQWFKEKYKDSNTLNSFSKRKTPPTPPPVPPTTPPPLPS